MSSSVKTFKSCRSKKLSCVLKNYHLDQIKKNYATSKKKKHETEPSIQSSVQRKTERVLNAEKLHKTMRLPTKKILVPKETRLKETFHLPVRCKPRRCAYCSTKNKPHKSSIKCETCNVALCMFKNKFKCFELFHKMKASEEK